MLEVVSPAEGAHLASVPLCGRDEVRAAVGRARVVQAEWAGLPLSDRVRRLGRVLPVLRERCDEIVGSIVAETGKAEPEALAEVAVVTDLVRYYLADAEHILRSRRVPTGWLLGKSATVHREPYGVIGVISPWNYPFILVMSPVMTALFAGNGVVVKPSEHTPLTGLLVPRILADAGIPEGLASVVTGDGTTGAELIAAGIDKVAFTGSPHTGRRIMAKAAEHLVPVSLELGGKDAAIVLEDADLDRAAAGVVFGAFFNAGQTCVSIERAFVVEAVFDAFVERVCHLAAALRTGAAGEFDVGPITTPQQLAVVERHIDDAVSKGARVLTGGERADPAANLVLPTVIVDVTSDMAVLRDETFGPVLPVVRVADEEEALRHANEGAYGLFASVWTGDRRRGEALARRIRAGGVSVNDVLTHYAVPGLPMGGVGSSGFGRTGGREGLEELTRTHTVLTHRWGLGKRELYWFPYRARTSELLRGVVTWRTGGGIGRLVRAFLGREP
jgi:acyl-CoA reductase-like NAD-dependent aldehyde dehydrogenase